jgi:hypothetical protein
MGKSTNLATDIAVSQVVIHPVDAFLSSEISTFSQGVHPSVNWIVMSGVQIVVDEESRDVLVTVRDAILGTLHHPPAEFNIDKFLQEHS